MPIEDDLRRIAESANRDLDQLHDFYAHSLSAWRTVADLVDEGRKFTWENAVTGTKVDQDEVMRLRPGYTSVYLATFTFRQFVSVFESFFFDFLHRLLLH